MNAPTSLFRTLRSLACAAAFFLAFGGSAQAWPWNSEPQPLLHDRTAIRADAGSPLTWDRSARILWFVAGGKLNFARWNGTTFLPGTGSEIAVNAGAGIVVDEGWHAVYFLDHNFHLQFARPSPGGVGLIRGSVGDESLSRLLAVDNRTHSVFAYDSVARGIRLYSYRVKTKARESSLIAPGLGKAGDTAAWDSNLRVLYSSHETADTTVPRHPRARSLGDPTGTGTLLPWPLVATAWDGRKWSSRVIDETGVPQLPAIRATDHTVFYARRDELDKLRTFRPVAGSRAELFSSVSGWSGADTFEDHDRYEIKAPNYPDEWENSGSVTTGLVA